jgi:hypothetical protein
MGFYVLHNALAAMRNCQFSPPVTACGRLFGTCGRGFQDDRDDPPLAVFAASKNTRLKLKSLLFMTSENHSRQAFSSCAPSHIGIWRELAAPVWALKNCLPP